MKWSVVVLIVLGVVAALCAALIVSSVTGQKPTPGPAQTGTEPKEVTYVVASRDLSARTLVESDATTLVNSPPQGAPVGAFSQQAQVIGQVLRRSIKKGAAFDASYFSSS